MVTIFCIPKAFKGHIGIIQRNAIKSWSRLHPSCEIILCADDPGTEDVAREFDTQYIPQITRNEYGTPLLNSAFEAAQNKASHPILCYVNADIILMSDFLTAIQRILFKDFLMVGKRWDVPIKTPWNFEDQGWEAELLKYVSAFGKRSNKWYIDYLVFPKKSELINIPAFAVGRPRWDNWMVYKARSLNIPVINASKVVTVVHQSHDYRHITKSNGPSWKWEGPEANQNMELIGKTNHLYNISDANYKLTFQDLVPIVKIFPSINILRYLKTIPILGPFLISLRNLLRYFFVK